MKFLYSIFSITLLVSTFSLKVSAQVKNGFELKDGAVPANKILHGGPGKDGIPSIDKPEFVTGTRALKVGLQKKDHALIVRGKKVTKAYPLSILNWHEVVNDKIEGVPIAVSYCPLCGTGITLERTVKDKVLEFGISGLLYQSDVLLYDRSSQSLWSQIKAEAIVGPHKGQKLKMMTTPRVKLETFLKKNPDTLVLKEPTVFPFARDYTRNPYSDYLKDEKLYFPVDHNDKKFKPKNWALFLGKGDDKHILVMDVENMSADVLKKYSTGEATFKVNKKNISLRFNIEFGTINCPSKLKAYTCFMGHYFALKTFHPKAKVWPISKNIKR